MWYRTLFLTVSVFCSVLSAEAQQTLSLSEAITTGLKQNYGIEIAKGVSQIASTRKSWGEAGAYPTLSFSLGGSASTNFETPQAGLNASWTLFNGFLVKTTKSLLANNEELAAGLEMLQIENTIKSIISSYYYVLLRNENVKIAEVVYKLSSDRYNQIAHAAELGSKGTYELIQAETALLEDEKQLVISRRNLTESFISLNKILSEVDVSKEWILSDSLAIPTQIYSLGTMEEIMFSNNTTLKNQYINQKAREIEIRQSESALYPTISLQAGLKGGYSGIKSNSDPFKSDFEGTTTGGVTLSYNLFNNGRARRNISIVQINKSIENTKTDEMKHTLKSSLHIIFNQYNIDKKIVDISSKHLTAANKNLKMSLERYKSGIINSFNFRDVQLSYMYSAVSHFNSIFDLVMADLELLQITGGILNEYN